MKRLMVAALVLSAIGGLGIWFGLPVYAENQFRQSLDAWAASRPSGKAGYAVAKLDFWAGRATIGSLTEVVVLRCGKQVAQLEVTLNDLVIDGYDFQAADRAIRGAATAGDVLASRVSWQSIAFTNDDQAFKGQAGAGSIVNFAAEQVDPLSLHNLQGISFDQFQQMPLEAVFEKDDLTLTGTAGPFVVTGYNGKGFDEARLGAFEAGLTGGNDQTATMSWESMSAKRLVRGEPTTLANAENLGFRARFDLAPTLTDEQANRPLSGQPTRGAIGWDVYRIEDARFDENVVALYRSMIALLAQSDAEISEAQIAELAEQAVQTIERAEQLKTGAKLTLLENMSVNIAGLQEMKIERMLASDLSGLTFGRMESTGQHQKDALGNVSSLESSVMRDVDLTALPGYLRKVLGNPVTVESLERVVDFYRDSTIAEATPAISFGVWEARGQKVSTLDGQNISIDRIALDAFKANEEGDATLALSLEGMGLDLAGLPKGSNPQADMGIAVLKSQGIEQLKMNMGISVEFSPTRGELAMHEAVFGADGIASLKAVGLLGGINVEEMRDMPAEAMSGAMMATVISQLEVEFTDLGGRDIAFALMGQQSDAKPEDMAFGLSLQAEQMIGSLGSARAEQIAQAVAAFVLSGGAVLVRANPKTPAPLVQFMLKAQTEGPEAVLELLQAEAEHTLPQ